jgi:predicted DNA binding CopG/RHH family protein
MKAKSNWEMPAGKLIRVRDFLPPPNQLVLRAETAKVTIALEKSSVDFFKRQAKKNHTKYQRMIRELLDRYASHYSRAA